jgi:hypothetical protein
MSFITCSDCGAKLDPAFPDCVFCELADFFAEEVDLESPGNRLVCLLGVNQPPSNTQTPQTMQGKVAWIFHKDEINE